MTDSVKILEEKSTTIKKKSLSKILKSKIDVIKNITRRIKATNTIILPKMPEVIAWKIIADDRIKSAIEIIDSILSLIEQAEKLTDADNMEYHINILTDRSDNLVKFLASAAENKENAAVEILKTAEEKFKQNKRLYYLSLALPYLGAGVGLVAVHPLSKKNTVKI